MTVAFSNLSVSDHNALAGGQLSVLLSEARHAAGYSVDDLAVTTGLINAEIENIENGTDADPVRVRRIAVALKVPMPAIRVS